MASVTFQTEYWHFTAPTRTELTLQTDRWLVTPPTRTELTLQTDRWEHSFKDSFTPRIEMY